VTVAGPRLDAGNSEKPTVVIAAARKAKLVAALNVAGIVNV
jgi:hypothetical protein